MTIVTHDVHGVDGTGHHEPSLAMTIISLTMSNQPEQDITNHDLGISARKRQESPPQARPPGAMPKTITLAKVRKGRGSKAAGHEKQRVMQFVCHRKLLVSKLLSDGIVNMYGSTRKHVAAPLVQVHYYYY